MAEHRRTHRFNLRFLLISLLLMAVIVPLAFYLHRQRKARNLQTIRQDALSAEAKGDWKETARLLRHYVQFHPEDFDASERLAQAMEKAAVTPAERLPAMGVYYKLLE